MFCVDEAQGAAFEGVVLAEDAGGSLAERLEYSFFGRTAADWCTALRAVKVPAAVVREEHWLHEFLRNDAGLADGRVNEFRHDRHGLVRVIAKVVRLHSQAQRRDVRAPLLGEHTAEVLAGLGFDAAAVEALTAADVVRAHVSAP